MREEEKKSRWEEGRKRGREEEKKEGGKVGDKKARVKAARATFFFAAWKGPH